MRVDVFRRLAPLARIGNALHVRTPIVPAVHFGTFVPSCTCSPSPPPLFSPQCNHNVPDAIPSIASAAQRACGAPTVTHVRYQAIRGRLGDASLRLYSSHEWWNEMRDAGVYVQVAPTADRYIGTEGTTTEPGPGGDPGER